MAYTPDNWTDKELKALEKRIAQVYKQAEKDLNKEIKEYFAKFKLRDKEMKALVKAGEMTKADYQQWRLTQMARGQRYEALRDKVAERYTQANEVANAYVNDMTPSIYSLNRNYEAYRIEKTVGSCDFTMWDESTVRRLLVEQPDLMPYYPEARALNRGIDLAYGKKQITKNVTSGIIRGLAPGKIANELMANMTGMNRASAVRAARTGITAAQNAGRMDSYVAAEKMGIQIKRRWVCTKDARTRLDHGMADGQIVVGIKKPFIVGGFKMMFPGDGSLGAPGHEIYNCRCTTRTVEKDGIEAEPRQMRVKNPVTGKEELVSEMTYSEWAQWKETGVKPVANSGNRGIVKVDNVLKTPIKSADKYYKVLLDRLGRTTVAYNPVIGHTKTLTQSEIITTLSGGDRTKGSCASLGLAYIGQKQGWNVIDFRGGMSCDFFSNPLNLFNFSQAVGVKTLKAQGASAQTVGNRLLKMCEIGKEYYLCVGRHASIVRAVEDPIIDAVTGEVKKIGTKYQYLELQHPYQNGWTDFNKNARETLSRRFGCRSTSDYGVSAKYDFMIDIDESDFSTDDFRSLLGYINTESTKQKKGQHGTIK